MKKWHNVGPVLGEICLIIGTTTVVACLIAAVGGTALAVVLMVGIMLIAWGLFEVGMLF